MTIDTQRLRQAAASVRAFLRPEYGREIAAAADHIDALTALAASKTEQCSALRLELEALRAGTNPELLASERAANAVLTGEVERLREALNFYADQDHFNIADEDAWDTVSGEPQNFWCDEGGTATVEDGSIARAALSQGEPKC